VHDEFENICKSLHIPSWVHFDAENKGLTYARKFAMNQIRNRVDQYLLLSTTCKFLIDLDNDLADVMEKNPGFTVFDVICENDFVMRDPSLLRENEVSFNEFFNNEDKPDFVCLLKNVPALDEHNEYFTNEKYNPEDVMYWWAGLGKVHINKLQLVRHHYNEMGLSRSFSRKFQYDNRSGFVRRAEVFLDMFLRDKFPLSMSRLKGLVDDLLTLSDTVPINKYEGTIIEPLLIYRLNSWIKNKRFNNNIKFIEPWNNQ
jgi:hypothetical protein